MSGKLEDRPGPAHYLVILRASCFNTEEAPNKRSEVLVAHSILLCKSIMAEIHSLRFKFSFSLLVLPYALTLISNPTSSLSTGFGFDPVPIYRTPTTNLNFDSGTALFGYADMVAVNNGMRCVKLTRPSISRFGLLMRDESFKFLDGNHPTSFSTELSFSIFPVNGDGDGLVLDFVPSGYWSKWLTTGGSFALSEENRFLSVGFDAKMDGNVGDSSASYVRINVNGVVSSSSLVLSNGDNNGLKSWIDYDASSKRLEVRLAKSGDARPYNPIMARAVDLAEMWMDEDVRVGIASRNGMVCSWRFRVRKFPNSIHTLPVDPRSYVGKEERGERVRLERRRVRPLSVAGCLIFATVCGASVAFVVLFLSVIFFKKHAAERPVYAVEFGYEKVAVDVEKNRDGLKNSIIVSATAS